MGLHFRRFGTLTTFTFCNAGRSALNANTRLFSKHTGRSATHNKQHYLKQLTAVEIIGYSCLSGCEVVQNGNLRPLRDNVLSPSSRQTGGKSEHRQTAQLSHIPEDTLLLRQPQTSRRFVFQGTISLLQTYTQLKLTKLRGLSPQANYTDRAAAAGRRS